MPTGFTVLIATMGLDAGGAETHIIELSLGLANRGVRVIVCSRGGVYEKTLAEAGILHYKVPLHNKRLKNVIKAYFALKQIILAHNIKLVHAHARIPAFLCGLLHKKMGFRFVTTAHFNFDVKFPYNLLSQWGERSVAVSADLKEYLVESYKVSPDKIALTINGIDTEKFARRREYTEKPYRVVCVTRLDKQPGRIVFTLIDALKILYERGFELKLTIVGAGDIADALSLYADKTLPTGSVTFTGARTDIPEILQAADIFVGISRAALEAMSMETPVVLAGGYGYIGRFCEEVFDKAYNTNFTCRGFPEATPALLADDITALLKEPPECLRKLGELGRETVMRYYSVGRMVDDAMSLYARVSYGAPAPSVLLFGYYGSGNNGDDAILKSIIDDLYLHIGDINITVLSRRPKQTALLHGVESIYLFDFLKIKRALLNITLCISGGGTLLQDITSTRSLIYYLAILRWAKESGARCMLYANGLGPVIQEKNRRRITKALLDVDCITLRDEASMRLLFELLPEAKAILAADVAFALKKPALVSSKENTEKPGGRDRYFVAALRRWKFLPRDFTDTAARFCDYMNDKYGLQTVFLSMQPSFDTKIAKQIIAKMKTKASFCPKETSTDEILAVTAAAEFVFSMRLHAIIYAAKAYVPSVAVAYDPKVIALMEITAQNTYHAAADISFDILKKHGDYVMENSADISAKIADACALQEILAARSIECAKEILIS